MRCLFTAIVLCALGVAGVSAAVASEKKATASHRSMAAQSVKASHSGARHHARGLGGIHPLVGSGDY